MTGLRAAAQIISDPENGACVATSGENCAATLLAVSNGGDAGTTCSVWFVRCGIAVSNGGSTGFYNPTTYSYEDQPMIGVAVAGAASGFLVAVGGTDSEGTTFPVPRIAANTGNATSCGFAIVLSLTGNASVCPADGSTTLPLGLAIGQSSSADCTMFGVAIAVTGPASSHCTLDVGTAPLMLGNLALSLLGPASTCDATASAAISVDGSATSCGTTTTGAKSDGVAASSLGSASAGVVAVSGGNATATAPNSAAVSGTGDASSGSVAISGTGNAYACGGAITFAFVPAQLVGEGGHAAVCPGTLPLP